MTIGGGHAQSAGNKYRGEVFIVDKNIIRVEMAAAYDIQGPRRLSRTVKICDNGIIITDNFDTKDLPIFEMYN